MQTTSPKNSTSPQTGEVYFEFRVVGNAVKVSAVDAKTGTEVAVMGPASGTHEELKRIALRKLQNRLAQTS